jgi:enoyl-CoA hydratase
VTTAQLTVPRAIEIATRIATASPAAARAAKRAVMRTFDLALAEGLREEREAMWALTATPERQSGLDAFAAQPPTPDAGDR